MKQRNKKHFVRFGEFQEIPYDDGVFLANDVDGSIHLIDQFSAALWRFLESPKTFEACASVFVSALPDVPKKKIEGRIEASLKRMSKNGWIIAINKK